MNIIFKLDTWQEIYHSLKNNKLRTFLTMIGVGWGMFLFVSLLGAAKGMENGFDKLFSGFATNSIFMWAQNTSIPYDGFPKGRKTELRLPDIELLERKIPEIDYISPQNSRGNFGSPPEQMSVSYTHLDVYKRQHRRNARTGCRCRNEKKRHFKRRRD